MNIVYGLSGEGLGHASRALVIIPYLQKLGHKVKVLADGKALEVLKDKFDTYNVQGMHFVFKNNRIKKRKTFLFNFRFLRNLFRKEEIKKVISSFNPDLFIVDFQPLIPILAKLYKKPLISIDNIHSLKFSKYKVPSGHHSEFVISRAITKMIVPYANYFIITSFIDQSKKDKNVFFVPPIIRNEIKKIKASENGPILVYINNANTIIPVLKKINEKFLVYGCDKSGKEGNLEFKTKETFLKDLSRCKAIIGTAGFSLISESIYLKKPMFTAPQKGQFEQLFNALCVKEKSFGEFSENPKKEEIEHFLRNLNKYRKKLQEYNPNYDEIYSAIDEVLKNIPSKKYC